MCVGRIADHLDNGMGAADSQTNPIENNANSEDEPSEDDSNVSVLEPFLNAKGITIKALPAEDPADQIIDSLSLYLGERYEALSSLLTKIKRAMQTGNWITESLRGRSQQDIGSACQFCTRLHEVAFLEQYQYSRSPVYLIKAKTTTLPESTALLCRAVAGEVYPSESEIRPCNGFIRDNRAIASGVYD